MTEELSGRRIVVPETRELDQLVRMLEERGAEAIPCPTICSIARELCPTWRRAVVQCEWFKTRAFSMPQDNHVIRF